jgi:hypothetical protein
VFHWIKLSRTVNRYPQSRVGARGGTQMASLAAHLSTTSDTIVYVGPGRLAKLNGRTRVDDPAAHEAITRYLDAPNVLLPDPPEV